MITGGLDSRLVMWDFSKGRPQEILDFSTTDVGQSLNPAFVHAVAVPDIDMVDRVGKKCAIARGDCVVDVIDIETELAVSKGKSSVKSKKGARKASERSVSPAEPHNDELGKRVRLDHLLGGHNAAVSCVAFSNFGEKGKFIISGGNDRSVKVWDWCKAFGGGQSSDNGDILSRSIDLKRKVNWLCTTPAGSENIVVCDTSKVVKVFSIT